MLHIFDLDHTLLSVNSGYHFSRYLYKKGLLERSAILQIYLIYSVYKLGIFSLEDVHKRSFKVLFQGKSSLTWTDSINQYLDENLNQILNQPVYQRLLKAQALNQMTAIFSSGADFIVEPIAKRLNINYIESSRYEVDSSQKFVKISSLLDGKAKAQALKALAFKHRIPLSKVTAYSDSIIDLPFLQAAARAVCVSPDSKLRLLAEKQRWEILIP